MPTALAICQRKGERKRRKGGGREGGRVKGEEEGEQRERFLELSTEVVLSSRLWYYLILAKLQMQISACPQNAVALE